ncbi:adenylate/guanylate cyclase domain-containing protein [Geminicoccus roseus]|uniref:adenylate/guanylate cyclase domain-containing protein n=1 Tax=Geminicoccus roseus TaxID=404900 RepID=UPI000480E3EE|nr:adenylate/guanylate cyclase domain-containing protein [Geminicoccus roseus]
MDVTAWLEGLGLKRYAPTFRANDIDAEILPQLTSEDVADLGISSIGHRRKLLNAIADLRVRDAAEAPATSRASAAERRHLTVMFVDLVGSTALSACLDPEEMREVLRTYQDVVAGAVARYGGHIAKLMGDGVLAYFGWPRAQEDEAERAVYAGLDIAAAVLRLASPTGEALAARVGIATGLVVVGDLVGEGAAQEEAVIGENPNLAARLQEAAAPGAVVVADGTRHLVGEMFVLCPFGATQHKGFAPGSRFDAHRPAQLLPMLGRNQELALLQRRCSWSTTRWRRSNVSMSTG